MSFQHLQLINRYISPRVESQTRDRLEKQDMRVVYPGLGRSEYCGLQRGLLFGLQTRVLVKEEEE